MANMSNVLALTECRQEEIAIDSLDSQASSVALRSFPSSGRTFAVRPGQSSLWAHLFHVHGDLSSLGQTICVRGAKGQLRSGLSFRYQSHFRSIFQVRWRSLLHSALLSLPGCLSPKVQVVCLPSIVSSIAPA